MLIKLSYFNVIYGLCFFLISSHNSGLEWYNSAIFLVIVAYNYFVTTIDGYRAIVTNRIFITLRVFTIAIVGLMAINWFRLISTLNFADANPFLIWFMILTRIIFIVTVVFHLIISFRLQIRPNAKS